MNPGSFAAVLVQATEEEVDEFLLFDDDGACWHPDDLPRRKLENWVLYDHELKFTSLELLPMQPNVECDTAVFGSGNMMEDDGEGYVIDDEADVKPKDETTTANAELNPRMRRPLRSAELKPKDETTTANAELKPKDETTTANAELRTQR